eukprot:TRINITY_DN8043_c0_g1_i2.p1 TRINITY_DN8043_c0_g1~~TRINITY_DN8043_c0_g1_i2.p1  ORF type:complete len:395 (-),score=14.23 TRINITY_DN8043_c0_g1_i2:186-1370(-)
MLITTVYLHDNQVGLAALRSIFAGLDGTSLMCGVCLLTFISVCQDGWGFHSLAKQLLALYVLSFTALAAFSLWLNPHVDSSHCTIYNEFHVRRYAYICAYVSLQAMCTLTLTALQYLLVTRSTERAVDARYGFKVGCLLLALACVASFCVAPETINEICEHVPNQATRTSHTLNMLWSGSVAVATVMFGILRIADNSPPAESKCMSTASFERHDTGEDEASESEWSCHSPVLVLTLIAGFNTVKSVTQFINTYNKAVGHTKSFVPGYVAPGSIGARVMIESLLTHGQGLFLFAVLLSDRCFAKLVRQRISARCLTMTGKLIERNESDSTEEFHVETKPCRAGNPKSMVDGHAEVANTAETDGHVEVANTAETEPCRDGNPESMVDGHAEVPNTA